MKRGMIGCLGTGVAWALLAGAPAVRAQQGGEPMARPPAAAGVYGLLAGSGAYLGVRIRDVDAERADEAGLDSEHGVYVDEVTEDGPAAEAGLEAGDVLVAWNGERLESVAQLQRLIRETPPGRTVELTVVREGGRRSVSVELGDRADAARELRVFTMPREREALRGRVREDMRDRLVAPAQVHVGILGARPRLGVSIQSLGEQLAEYFGVEDGALVVSVNEDSPAEAAGMRAGDVIIAIDGGDVDDPGDVGRLLYDRDAGPVEVRVMRDGSERTLTVELEEPVVGDNGGNGVFYFGGDGDGVWLDGVGSDAVHIDPFIFGGLDIGPIEVGGMDIEIPEIQIPRFEMPSIEIPRIVVPRRAVSVGVVEVSA